ncbi:hypothetical protein [Streptococcus pluranimalium]|uniref:Uncharacterized protein n=1 Tax=Streptococcus pluranimalium TaxID=82348 RepID=A0A345VJJ5_9STRE|nr:hypothetical protein [Streptococcus pluranimalium]AXJ12897.1 hypothetical protein Sp14A_09760 [Streptococcus pluranimalium]
MGFNLNNIRRARDLILKEKQVNITWYIYSFVVLGVGLYFYYLDHFIVLMTMVLLMYIGLLVVLMFRRKRLQVVQQWLNNGNLIEEYRLYYELAYKKARGIQKKLFLQESYLADGQYYFLTGEFEKAYHVLSQIDVTKTTKKSRVTIEMLRAYYRALCALYLSNDSAFETNLLDLEHNNHSHSKVRVEKLLAISTIMKQDTINYFKEITVQSKLEKIEQGYYQGLNLLNVGDVQGAKKQFQKLRQENIKLFYVKNARKLEERHE